MSKLERFLMQWSRLPFFKWSVRIQHRFMKKVQLENWRRTLKHQKRAQSKAGSHIILSGVHVPTFFFYKFICWVELRLLCSSLSNMAWVSDIQRNGAWAEREREENLSFFSFPPTLTLLESLTLWPFYVWCALILNQDPTVRLLQSCGHVRTGYETGYNPLISIAIS